MRRYLSVLTLVLLGTGSVQARGLLIPEDKTLPPLAMLNHQVTITIEDQVAVTRVEQTFRNHTDRQLEATYVFPVPKGAGVDEFAMWVGDKKVKGELLPAEEARQIYTSIVRRTQDPGLLEYMDNNLLRMRVFPIPAHGDQKVALTYKYVAPREGNLVEYVYPLKTDGKAIALLEKFSISATLKSQHNIQNVYSPTHSIDLKRTNDREVTVSFDRGQALMDRDFQLFYSLGDSDIGLTSVMQRPIAGENGYFMLLVSPRLEMSAKYEVPRDVVLVLDTSGSMRGVKIDQARKALKYVLGHLSEKDRFGVIHFATTVNKYRDSLTESSKDQIEEATKWVDRLEATGGTAINDALLAALDMRTKEAAEEGRVFTVVFFTDGCPTIGVTEPDKILKNVLARNSGNTRIFTFGVGYGDNINASLLDQLADQSRAVSTYVRPEEDIQAKVAGLYGKISHPVLANLKLTTTNDIHISEMYPPQLPDLFHGGQLVVFGRYSGKGAAAIRLTGNVGKETREFVYETSFAERTKEDRSFVEQLWARRKVGYLLDQVRANGEKRELVDEIVNLAKKYGITTPYTSYLIVPDAPVPGMTAGNRPANVTYAPLGGTQGRPGGAGGPPASGGGAGMPGGVSGFGGGIGGISGGFGGGFGGPPPALQPPSPTARPVTTEALAKKLGEKPGELERQRGAFEDDRIAKGADGKNGAGGKDAEAETRAFREAKEKKQAYDDALTRLRSNAHKETQEGQLGVQLSEQTNNLRAQTQLDATAQRNVAGRNCLEFGGVWIDEGYTSKAKSLVVKAQSDAYFRLLERHPELRSVFQLGNHLVWMTPNGTALIIDTQDGKDKLNDKEIDDLFVAKK